MKIILKFTSHVGYYCCFYCYIKGVHVGGRGGKWQYYYADRAKLRDASKYQLESIQAEQSSSNINGHLGLSILHNILDVPLPKSIIVDYLHVTLLRHARAIIHQSYLILTPGQRKQIDAQLLTQKFPNFFNRKVRAINDLSFIK